MRFPNLLHVRKGGGLEEVEGTIHDFRVVRDGQRESWLFRLDTRPNATFCFEPSALSARRRVGDRVRVAYRVDAPAPGRLNAEWIAAAETSDR
jgi:hypothetical protein